MEPSGRDGMRFTRRGVATRNRIVAVAAELIQRHGITETNLDQVMEATGASKSQLYHYFENKDALLREAAALQVQRVLGVQGRILQGFDSMAGLEQWTEAVLQFKSRSQGCPLGALVYQIPRTAKHATKEVASGMEAWRQLVEDGLGKMKSRGELGTKAIPSDLALAVLAALQGGLLLSRSSGTDRALEISLAMALSHVKSFIRPLARVGP